MFEFSIYMLIDQKYLEFSTMWKLLVSQSQVQTSSSECFVQSWIEAKFESYCNYEISNTEITISSCFRKKENKFLRLLYFLTR